MMSVSLIGVGELGWRPLVALLGALGLMAVGGGLAVLATPRQVPGPDPSSVQIRLEPFVQGLENPVAFAAPNDGSSRLFVVEKAGRIKLIRNGQVQGRLFLDVTGRVESAANERGLLGLAFHPDYASNGVFVVAYTARSPQGQITYSRFRVSADPERADPNSEQQIIAWAHPRGNHNGGEVQFGPDGYLYLGTGDGGGGGDPDRNGQNGQTFLGKMLRLDIDTEGAEPYRIPADNPFVANPDIRDEIWAFGLRNPWRYSFDRATGDLYIADVGQNQIEEVNFEAAGDPGGRNYGWNIMEGSRCFNAATCNQTGLTLPIIEYTHQGGHCSVTGGYVYRGEAYPSLQGLYFFADWCTSVIWAASRNEAGVWRYAEVGRQANMRIQAFGEDSDGELYVLGANGRVMRLVASGAPLPPSPTPSDDPTPTAVTATPSITATVATATTTSEPETATPTTSPVASTTPEPSPTAGDDVWYVFLPHSTLP